MFKRLKIMLIISLSFFSFLFFSEIIVRFFDGNAKYLENIRSILINSKENNESEINKNKLLLNYLEDNKLGDFAKCLRNSSDRVLCSRADGVGTFFTPDLATIDKYLDNYDFPQEENTVISSESLSQVDARYPDLYARDTAIISKRDMKKDNFLNKFEEYIDNPNIIYSNFSNDTKNRINILVLADSFGAGDGLLNTDETWVRELESQLNSIDDRFSFTLVAASGSGYYDYLQWIERGLVDKIKPDIVIISFFENDFDFIDSGVMRSNSNLYSQIDNKISYYIKCFEKDDTIFTRSASFFSSIFPNLYRYLKFLSCGDSYSNYDTDKNVNYDEVFKSYQRIDELVNVPLFFYDINYRDTLIRSNFIKDNLIKNGFKFLNNNDNLPEYISSICGGKELCESLIASKFNFHYSYMFNKKMISISIDESYDLLVNSVRKLGRSDFTTNNNLVSDYLPRSVSIEDKGVEGARVGFLNFNTIKPILNEDEYDSYLRNFYPYLCTKLGRPFQIINLNRYLTDNKSFEVVFEKVNNVLHIGTLGYDSNGVEIISDFSKVFSGSKINFIGSESIRSLILISNDKGCYDKEFEVGKTFTEYLFTIKLL